MSPLHDARVADVTACAGVGPYSPAIKANGMVYLAGVVGNKVDVSGRRRRRGASAGGTVGAVPPPGAAAGAEGTRE